MGLGQRKVDKLVQQVGDLRSARASKMSKREAMARCHEPDVEYTTLTAAEQMFLLAAVSKSAKAFRSGWPDFLLERDGKTFCVEVKCGDDDVSFAQIKMFAALERAGLAVYIWNPTRADSLKPWRGYRPEGSVRR